METFFVKSNIGDLVVQVGEVHEAERRWKPWRRIASVSGLFKREVLLPVPKIILSVAIDSHYFVVQQRIKGRSLKSNASFSPKLMQQIEKCIAEVHAIRLSGAGPIVGRGKKAKGKHKNWREFLDRDIPQWLERIRKVEGDSVLTTTIADYYEKNKYFFNIRHSCLVHGDLLNLSNILIADGKISGIVDWEFAMAGDPAWEFCAGKKYNLRSYFRLMKMNQKERREFIRRAKLYQPLFLARVMSLNDSKNKEYLSCRNRLKKLMEKNNSHR